VWRAISRHEQPTLLASLMDAVSALDQPGVLRARCRSASCLQRPEKYPEVHKIDIAGITPPPMVRNRANPCSVMSSMTPNGTKATQSTASPRLTAGLVSQLVWVATGGCSQGSSCVTAMRPS